MNAPPVARSHGGVRGANLSRSSLLFDGPFGRIFRALPPAVSLNPLWTPTTHKQNGVFGLRELITAALNFTIQP
jgi:hypothetical protein